MTRSMSVLESSVWDENVDGLKVVIDTTVNVHLQHTSFEFWPVCSLHCYGVYMSDRTFSVYVDRFIGEVAIVVELHKPAHSGLT